MLVLLPVVFFFFFKQKTAYEMRISDWSSDVCSSDLLANDACHLAGRTLVSAAIMRFDGQLSTYKSHEADDKGGGEKPCYRCLFGPQPGDPKESCADVGVLGALRSEEHTSELQSLMRISYAVFCLKKKNIHYNTKIYKTHKRC